MGFVGAAVEQRAHDRGVTDFGCDSQRGAADLRQWHVSQT